MKKLIWLLLLGVFAACSNEKTKDPKTTVFIEEKLNDFIVENEDWSVETMQLEITEKFKHKVINLSNEADFLKNMPLQFKGVADTSINAETYKIATFKAYKADGRPTNSLLNDMELQINGIVSDAQAKTLTVGKNYILTGTLYKQGKRADVKMIPNKDFNIYDLGKYTFSITSFKER